MVALSFWVGLRRTPVGVGSWGGGSGQFKAYPERPQNASAPRSNSHGLTVEKTDPEREGVGDFLVDLSESEIRGIMTE